MAAAVSSSAPARKHRFDRVRSRDTTSSSSSSTTTPAAALRVSGQDPRSELYMEPHGHHGSRDLRVQLPVRPSTAGASVSTNTSGRRQSRDNLPVNPLTAHNPRKTVYDFPLPGATPFAIRYSAASTAPSSSSESHETESMSSSGAQSYGIGMALGSPSHPPSQLPPHQPYYESLMFDRAATESPDTLEAAIDIWKDQAPMSKPKASKWKSLGGLFGKKSQRPAQAFYQLQTEHPVPPPAAAAATAVAQPQHTRFPSPPPEPSERERSRSRTRARTTSERHVKHTRPEPKRAVTAPLNFDFDRTTAPPQHYPELRLDSGPLLSVDIPDVHLERYSVMFGSVLKPAGLTGPRSSLLARRQATLDKLKLVNEAIAEHERKEEQAHSHLLRPRRATSPNVAKSPSFSLYPTPQQNREPSPLASKHNAYGLYRSNTSPAAITPTKQTFDLSSKPTARDSGAVLGAASLPRLQPATSQTLSMEHEQLEFTTSPVSHIMELHDPLPLKPTFTEPQWEMIAKPSKIPGPTPSISVSSTTANEASRRMHSQQSSSSTTASGFSDSTNASSMPSPININKQLPVPKKASMPESKPARTRAQTVTVSTQNSSEPNLTPITAARLEQARDEAEAAAETAASISIARQISVSQRQRQLLVPITRPTKPRSATLSASHKSRPTNLQSASASYSKPAATETSPSPRSELIHAQNTNQEQYSDSKVILPARPSTSSAALPSPSSGSFPIQGGLQPAPRHHHPSPSQLSPPSTLGAAVPAASPAPSLELAGRRLGSVRAARLALAGVGTRQHAEAILASDAAAAAAVERSPVGTPIPVGEEHVLVREGKLSTPTLVLIEGKKSSLGVAAPGGRGHMHRKSERGVLEHA